MPCTSETQSSRTLTDHDMTCPGRLERTVTVLFRAERMVTCHKGLVLTAFCSLSQVTSSHPLVTLQVAVTRVQVQIFRPCGPQTHPLTVPCHKRSPGPPPILYETFCHTSQAHPLCAEKYSTSKITTRERKGRKVSYGEYGVFSNPE